MAKSSKPTSSASKKSAAKKGAAKKNTTKKPGASAAKQWVPPAPASSIPPLATPRTLERLMSSITRQMAAHEFTSLEEAQAYLDELLANQTPETALDLLQGDTPLERAQDLVYASYEVEYEADALTLLIRALATSWDCADAYVGLAEIVAESPAEALSLYEQGLRAAERTLDPALFTEAVGEFWGLIETRPYMRARAGLAEALFALGQVDEAIGHYRELLRLNPNDNQGNRYTLLSHLLMLRRHEEAQMLIEQYREDGSAAWLFNSALLAFRAEGNSPRARGLLDEGMESNPFVAEFIMGRRALPKALPEFIEVGEESEALYYLVEAGPLWSETPGAVDWFKAHAPATPTRRKKK